MILSLQITAQTKTIYSSLHIPHYHTYKPGPYNRYEAYPGLITGVRPSPQIRHFFAFLKFFKGDKKEQFEKKNTNFQIPAHYKQKEK